MNLLKYNIRARRGGATVFTAAGKDSEITTVIQHALQQIDNRVEVKLLAQPNEVYRSETPFCSMKNPESNRTMAVKSESEHRFFLRALVSAGAVRNRPARRGPLHKAA